MRVTFTGHRKLESPTESYHEPGVLCDRYAEMYGFDDGYDDGCEGVYLGRVIRRESDGQWEVGLEIMLERGAPCYEGSFNEVKESIRRDLRYTPTSSNLVAPPSDDCDDDSKWEDDEETPGEEYEDLLFNPVVWKAVSGRYVYTIRREIVDHKDARLAKQFGGESVVFDLSREDNSGRTWLCRCYTLWGAKKFAREDAAKPRVEGVYRANTK